MSKQGSEHIDDDTPTKPIKGTKHNKNTVTLWRLVRRSSWQKRPFEPYWTRFGNYRTAEIAKKAADDHNRKGLTAIFTITPLNEKPEEILK